MLHVQRLKKGLSTTHPLKPLEIRAIKAWQTQRAKINPDTAAFFISERGRPLSRKRIWDAARSYGELAGLPLPAHPHMLRLCPCRPRGRYARLIKGGQTSGPAGGPPKFDSPWDLGVFCPTDRSKLQESDELSCRHSSGAFGPESRFWGLVRLKSTGPRPKTCRGDVLDVQTCGECEPCLRFLTALSGSWSARPPAPPVVSHSRLPGAPEHSAHRDLYGSQSGRI